MQETYKLLNYEIHLIFLLISSAATAQDSTKVKNLPIMVRQLEYIASQLVNIDDDSLYQVYIDLRPKFRIPNPPTGNTLVTIDSIPTTDLAAIYNYCLSNSDGMGYGSQFKATIASARAANSYLNRLCTEYELQWSERLLQLRLNGRRLLRGKQ
jgi:hypothetical protein